MKYRVFTTSSFIYKFLININSHQYFYYANYYFQFYLVQEFYNEEKYNISIMISKPEYPYEKLLFAGT